MSDFTTVTLFVFQGRISVTFSGSGLNGTWSWNHSNFHKNDALDVSYTDPNFIPLYSITAVNTEVIEVAVQRHPVSFLIIEFNFVDGTVCLLTTRPDWSEA